MKRKRKVVAVPAPGGESFGVEELGEPVYKVRLLPGGGVAPLKPGENPLPEEAGQPLAPTRPFPQAPVPPASPLPPT
jgi:hypothetical protein